MTPRSIKPRSKSSLANKSRVGASKVTSNSRKLPKAVNRQGPSRGMKSHSTRNHSTRNHSTHNHRTHSHSVERHGAHTTATEGSAEKLIGKLRADGFRITKLRSFILSTLEHARGPLAVADLRAATESAAIPANKTSIYRELYFLMEQRAVSEVDFLDGMKRYEFIAHDGHHHHIVCKTCSTVECIEVCFDLDAVLKEIAKKSAFKVENHVLEFFGTCSKCASP